MNIKEILWEHDFRQFSDLAKYENNGRLHNVAESFNECIDNFIKACNSGVWEPKTLLKTYKSAFKECENSFKTNVLLDKNAKSGIVVGQYQGMVLDEYIHDRFNFKVTMSNTLMNYSSEKLYELALYEVSILYHKYNKLYDFQIRYAIVWLLLNRFNFINQSAEVFGTGYNTVSYNANDIDNVYTMVLNTEAAQLSCFTPDLLDTIIKVKQDRPQVSKSDKAPKTLEEIEFVIRDCETQKEKQEALAKYYNVSTKSAQRWMKKFGLLMESNAEKHFRKLQEQHTEIISEVQKSKDEIIAEQDKRIAELEQKVDNLTKQNELLLKKIDDLSQKLFYAMPNKKDYINEVSSSSELNFAKFDENLNF